MRRLTDRRSAAGHRASEPAELPLPRPTLPRNEAPSGQLQRLVRQRTNVCTPTRAFPVNAPGLVVALDLIPVRLEHPNPEGLGADRNPLDHHVLGQEQLGQTQGNMPGLRMPWDE